MAARRIKIILAYDGTDYAGWQVQPGLPTIQGALQDAFLQVEKRPVHVEGSGRTDAGVHALAQVAAVTLQNPIPTTNLQKALNRLLPRDIRVLSASEADPQFHPRFDAVDKTYEYRIWREEVCSPFDRRYVHHHPFPMSDDRFTLCARLFEGEHDFTAFAARDDSDVLGKSKVRQIFRSEAQRDGGLLVFRVTGSGFLKHMVRNLAGTLLQAAKGNFTDLELLSMLRQPSGVRCGPTAPPSGLFLKEVRYQYW